MRAPSEIIFEVPAEEADSVFGIGETYELVEIDCGKLHEIVGGFYSEKVDKFERYLRENRNVEVPTLIFRPASLEINQRVRFYDGRHRFTFLYKYLGMSRIPVAVASSQAGICRQLLG